MISIDERLCIPMNCKFLCSIALSVKMVTTVPTAVAECTNKVHLSLNHSTHHRLDSRHPWEPQVCSQVVSDQDTSHHCSLLGLVLEVARFITHSSCKVHILLATVCCWVTTCVVVHIDVDVVSMTLGGKRFSIHTAYRDVRLTR